MPSFEDLLGVQHDGDAVSFHIPDAYHGAFGGVFGGFLASACIEAARRAAPGRVPNAIDCRFVRGLREPDAVARPTVLHAGRSLTNVSVDLVGSDGKLCTRSLVSLVEPGVLHALDRPGTTHRWRDHGDASAWPAIAPIVEALDPRIVGEDERGTGTAVVVPWMPLDGRSAEAACVATDMAVGPPLGTIAAGERISTPNPDLAVRFCGEITSPVIVGVGRVERASGGVAVLSVEAWSDGRIVATGISSALLVPIG